MLQTRAINIKMSEKSEVGTNHSGPDDIAKVQGELDYAADFSKEEVLHSTVVRSSEPAAKILAVDIQDAVSSDGVKAVITADDIPNNEPDIFTFGQSQEMGIHDVDSQILADEEVRYVGEPIALVAAETKRKANQAAKNIDINYESLEGVFKPEEAIEEDAPRVHDGENTMARWRIREGDINSGFDAADIIVENTYETVRQEHAHLEPESGVAWVDDDGVVNLRVATQVTEQYQEIAKILELPASKVHLQGTLMGGAFGGKEDLTVEPYLGVLALETNRPVKLTYDREDMFIGRHKRSPFKLELKHGATKKGHLTAMEGRLVADAGATVDLTPAILMCAVANATGPYHIPNVNVDGYAVFTNNTPGSAFRSFGNMEVALGIEQQMDALAKRLNQDTREFRNKNYLESYSETVTGQSIDSEVNLEETQVAAWEALGEPTGTEQSNILVGRGIASSWESYGIQRFLNDSATVWISLEMDGSVVVRSGIPDLGGGQRESLRQIAGAELGVPTNDVRVTSTDSIGTPLSGKVAGTRGLFMSGQAIKKATETLKEKIVKQAKTMFEDEPYIEDITLSEKVVRNGTGESLSLETVINSCSRDGRRLEAFETFYADGSERFEGDCIQGDVFPDYTFSSQAAEVKVDTRTGVVSVEKLTAAHDVGKAINPARVRGQIEGGALQGLGFALSEDYTLNEGIPQQRTMEEYHVPTVEVVPEFKSIILESESGKGPYGAKGIGEPAITATAPAIMNAIQDATGVRIKELPADPETILSALTDER